MKNLLWILFPFLALACSAPGEEPAEDHSDGTVTATSVAVDTSYTGKPLNRFEEAILAFEEEDKSRIPNVETVLFIGSSSIRMWKTLSEDFAPIPVLNRGFGGSTLPEVIHYAGRIIFPYAPKTIVLYCGENDIAEGASPEQVFGSFQILDRMIGQKLPDTDLVYIAMKPSPARWALWPQYRAGDRRISEYISTKERRYFVDCGPPMLLPSGEPDSSIFIEDMLHMNAAGYDRWQMKIKPLVSEIVQKQNQ